MNPSRTSVVFMGTPAFAVPALEALLNASYPVSAVYTQPPRAKGRGHQLQKSPVHTLAEAEGIPVFTPPRLRDDLLPLQRLKPDLIVVAAYGQILPPSVLAIPLHGCLNLHASLLPRWRGASPIQRAILSGDTLTGVTLMLMDVGMDTGAMLGTVSCPVTSESTTPSLTQELAHLGANYLIQRLPAYLAGGVRPVPQPDAGVTLAPKITAAEGELRWTSPASFLDRQVRALGASPGTWFMAGAKRFKVQTATCGPRSPGTEHAKPGTILNAHLWIACADGSAFCPLTLTPEGSRLMTGEACGRGYAFLAPGEVLL